MRCEGCGTEGNFELIPRATRHWTWGDGRVFEVEQFRCLTCAALDTVRRDVQAEAEKHEPRRGQYAPTDGLRFVARPLET